jgi:chorismate dehydratase
MKTMQSRVETKLQQESNTRRQLGNQVVRIGAVSYLNSKPLIYGLSDSLGESGTLSLAVPSQLAMELNSHSIDIGLIPVVEYFQNPEFRIVSNAAIACRGPVWSVRIFFRCDPSQVKTLALDEGSRTSAALSKVLFHDRFGFVPKTISLPITADPLDVKADAVLVIGDRAMHPENFRGSFCSDWDLGQEWLAETGLPFVFAIWVARNSEFATEDLKCKLEQTRDEGIENIRKIALTASSDYRLTPDQCEDYLTNYIRFFLRKDELAGLDEFRRRCLALGLISF